MSQPSKTNRIQVLVVTGRDHFHHRWRSASRRIREILEERPYFEVRVTEAFEGATSETLKRYDVVILNYFGAPRPAAEEIRWGKETEEALYDFVREGGGLVVTHSSFWMGASWGAEGDDIVKLFGATMRPTSRRGPGEGIDIHLTQPDHPITRGLVTDFVSPVDDKYVNMTFAPGETLDVLAETTDPAETYLNGAYYGVNAMPGPKIYTLEDARKLAGVDKKHPISWTKSYGKGRVFAISFGHVGASTIQDAHRGRKEAREIGPVVDIATRLPQFITMLIRGTEWAATGNVTDTPQDAPDVPDGDE
jgi:type 1 glutamine amidotransferase